MFTPRQIVDSKYSYQSFADDGLTSPFHSTSRNSFLRGNFQDPLSQRFGASDGLVSSYQNSAALEPGVFRIGTDGTVKVDFLFDSGAHHGEVAIFSLEGMDCFQTGSLDYIREAASRALSNSKQGHVVISDWREGAKFTGALGEGNFNDGPYLGAKTIEMRPGDTVGFMMVSNGTVEALLQHGMQGGSQTPFFSIASANPKRTTQLTQVVEGVFGWEDIWLGGKSDRDYNDIIFSVHGLAGTAAPFGESVSKRKDWRNLKLGQDIINSVLCPEPELDQMSPAIVAALFNDTAPGGTTNTDKITANPTITGTLTDASQIVEFRAGFGTSPESSYVNVLASRREDGHFTLGRTQLEAVYGGILQDGTYTLHLRARDQYSNASGVDITFTLDTTTRIPTVDLLVSSDTGLSDSDNVTRDSTPTIAGTAEAGALVQLFSNNTLINQTTASLGTWEFTTAPLTNGVYTVKAIATDIAGNVSPFSAPLAITIDTALPTLTLSSPVDIQPLTPQSRLVGSVSGTGSSVVALSYRFNDLEEVPISFNAQGAFDQLLNLHGLNNGNHNLTVTVVDQTGNTKVSQFTVTVSADEAITLREGQSFEVNLDRALTALQQPSILSFIFNANFDLTDLDSIKDAFEVALVDETGNSLVHATQLQRDSFFNLSEGQSAALGAGIRLNQQTVSLDLPALPQGRSAKLIFRLVNNDQDTNTVVTVTNLQVQSGGQGVGSAIPLVPRTYQTTTPNFAHLTDVSPSLSVQYGRTSFNAATQVLYSDVSIRNQGTYPVREQLLVVVKNLSNPSVRVLDPDGYTPEGLPYYDFTSLLSNGLLSSGQLSQARSLAFYNPNEVQFTYDLEFLGQVNQAPAFSTQPDTEALVDRPYIYDTEAVDPNRDPLTYKLLIGPQGVAVDAATGVVSWTPTITDLGTHTVTLEVSDGLGGTAQQTYTLDVVNNIPNRPPTFTSIPIVDARVNTPYTYDVNAIDPDGDSLSYRLLSGPSSLAIDAATGNIIWRPLANQLGTQTLKVEVADGRGGIANQDFAIQVLQERGNHAPVIVSQPIIELSPTITNRTSVEFVNFSDLSPFRLNGNARTANPAIRDDQSVLRLVESFDYQNGSALLRNPFELVGANGENLSFRTSFEFQIADSRGVSDGDGAGADGLVFVISPVDTVGGAGEGIGYGGLNRSIGVEFDTYQNSSDISGNHIGIDINGNLNSLVSRTVETDRFNNGQVWHSWVDYDGSTQQLEVRISQTSVRPAEAFVSQQLDLASILGQENFFVGFTAATGSATGTHDILAWNFEVGASLKEAKDYRYTVVAVDSDQDLLTYSLIQAPVGMTIDSSTGEIRWRVPTLSPNLIKNGSFEAGEAFPGLWSDVNAGSTTIEGWTVAEQISWHQGQFLASDGTHAVDLFGSPSSGVIKQTFATQPGQTYKLTFDLAGNPFDGPIIKELQVDAAGQTAQFTFDITGRSGSNMGWESRVWAFTATETETTLQFSSPDKQGGLTGPVIDNVSVVVLPKFDVGVRADDGRGGFDIQEYTIQVSEALSSEILGSVWNDLNGNRIKETAPESQQLIENFSLGYYNDSIGDLFTPTPNDPLAAYFPGPDVSTGDPTVNFQVGPNLDEITRLGSWLSDPASAIRNGFWRGLQPIPPGWSPNTESAIIYEIDGGAYGISDVQVSIGVDNGVFVWANGEYKLGGIASGPTIPGEYLVSLGNLRPGKNYIQILREDHGGETTSDINITGKRNSEPGLSGVTVFLDLNNNGLFDTGEPSQLTSSDDLSTPNLDETGQYHFTGLRPDTYIVREVVPSGSTQTFPASQNTSTGFHTVLLGASEIIQDINFGNQFSGNVPLNRAPAFATNAPTTAQLGTLLRYEAIARDPDNDTLIYDLPVKPDGMAIDSATGIVVWQPTFDQSNKTYDVVLRVRDGKGGVDLQAFQLVVPAINTDPTITSNPTVTAVAGLPYQYRVRAQDAEEDSLTFQLTQAPGNATIDATTGVLNFTPVIAQLGNQSFNIKVSDGKSGETVQTFALNVVTDAPNNAPVITSKPREVAVLNRPYVYQVNAFDVNGDPLTFTLNAPPSGLTVNEVGLIIWTPTAQQFGSNSISLQVSDGRGGTAVQNFAIQVGSQGSNQAPTITSIPQFGGAANREYQYNTIASDPDGDPIQWSLKDSPIGMSINSQSGAIRWTPALAQIGIHEITVQALDSFGGVATQTFEVTVRGINTPPIITSTPKTQAFTGRDYTYTINAKDADNDPLTFTLLNAPDGMTLSPNTGVIRWTPNNGQRGVQTVDLLVADGQGGVATQTFSVSVLATQPNSLPVITSQPGFVAATGLPYSYAVTASDADGDVLSFLLLQSPDGVTIDANTGQLQWTPRLDQQGTNSITVAVTDLSGGGSTQQFPLLVRVNDAPQITSNPISTATAGALYRYDIRATDPNADPLSFTLLRGPNGMTLDQFGRLSWSPNGSNLGTYQVQVSVTDTYNATAIQTYDLRVQPDQSTPLVKLVVSEDQVNVGTSVNVQVLATDNVGIKTLTLRSNGTPLALDAQGRATLQVNALGALNLSAIATDAAGNIGSAQTQIFVIDPTDRNAPVVDLTSFVGGQTFTTLIKAPTGVLGTVTDDNLLYYTLAIAPVAGGNFTEILRGTNTVNQNILGTFDPSMLQNDSYILRLSATDAGGLTAYDETLVSVAGDLKIGNFQLSFTDLSIPVAGIPIQVTRTYDTLTANTTDEFGYGWRLEFRDTDLRTSLGRDAELEELGVPSKGFAEGDRVYITLPGGQREAFTFKPQARGISRYFPALGGGDSTLYTPAFQSDSGVTSTLTVEDVTLMRSETGEFISLNGGKYNPAAELYGFGGYYKLTTKEGVVYRINTTTGDLETVSDRNGNTLTFTDAAITSSTGQQVTFERDAQGRITAVIDPAGKRVNYTYDALGDLVAVTDRTGSVTRFDYNDSRLHYLDDVIDPLGRSGVRTEYDASGRLVKMIDAAGNPVQLIHDPNNFIEQVRDQLGNITTYEYDQRGNVLTEINPLGGVTRRSYDADNNTLTETDPLGNTTRFSYDSSGNVLTETDPLGNVTRYTYDRFGNILTTTGPTGQTTANAYNARGNLTQITGQASGPVTFSYDAFGNLTGMQGGSGATAFEYDARGNITRQTDALGHVTAYTYDANGNRLTETTTQTTSTGVRTLVTRMVYDAQGRVIQTINAEGGVTRTVYDAAGNRVEEIDALGRSTKYVYDERGQLIQTIHPDSTPNDATDNSRIRTEYDVAGQVIAEIDELGRRTQFVYDALGRNVATIYPDATPTIDTDNPRTRTEYDAASRVLAQIDERGNRTEFRYDAAGRLTETIYPDATPNNLADNPRTKSTYDAAGRQLTQIDPLEHVTRSLYDDLGRPVGQEYADGTRTSVTFDAAGRAIGRTDQAGKTTQYEYDALGRLTAVIDALSQRTAYTYDEQGSLMSQRDANGHVTRYEYDGLGRRIATALPLGQRSSTLYDAVGNMVSTTDFNGDTITYAYNPRNWLTAKDLPGTEFDVTYTYTLDGQRQAVTDSRGITTYAYDARNQLLQRIDPDGRRIGYTYDLAGNRTSVVIPSGTTTYTFDAQNRLSTVTDPTSGVTAYTYNPVGNLIRTTLPNNTVEIRQYNDLNRLLYLENSSPNGIINSFRYTLDPTGNRTAVQEQDDRRVAYTYDHLYRLTQEAITDAGATNPTRTIGYSYDPVGNRLSRNDSVEGVTTYSYDANGRLLNATTNGVATTYAYDNNGNTLSRTTGGNRVTYLWNAENRLTGADTNGDGTIDVTNRYNENGIRVSQALNGQETRFLIDTNRDYAQVLEEYTPGGSVNVSYVYGHDLISQNRGGDRSFYHVDGLGSTRSITNGQSIVVNRYTYDAFGEVLADIKGIENSYLFAGELRDSNLNTDYLRERYLQSSLGRFISRDSFEGWRTIPISLNHYTYAHSSPLINIDPSGFSATTIAETQTAMLVQTMLFALAAGTALEIASELRRDSRDMNRMTFQLQVSGKGVTRDKSTVQDYALAYPFWGVTVLDAWNKLFSLDTLNQTKSVVPSRLQSELDAALVETQMKILNVYAKGGIQNTGNIKELQTKFKGRQVEYRVDVQNDKGWNLRRMS